MGTFAKIVTVYLVVCIAADCVRRVKENNRRNNA